MVAFSSNVDFAYLVPLNELRHYLIGQYLPLIEQVIEFLINDVPNVFGGFNVYGVSLANHRPPLVLSRSS